MCGISAPPDHPRVAKTALGAERAVLWTYYRNGVDAAVALKAEGYRLWALESGPRAESLFGAAVEVDGGPAVLVVGNEQVGVDPGILEQCERVLALPMQGQKESLNAAVAFGVAVYTLRYGLLRQQLAPKHAYIEIAQKFGGPRAIIKGTSIPVSLIIGYFRIGETPESLIKEVLPHLTLAQVYDALSYYHDHQDEIEEELRENTEERGRAYLREHLGEEGYLKVTGQAK